MRDNPWLQTASGIAFDLIDPKPSMVNFHIDIAESLARQARFNGHVRSGPYSVAQHCVLGADALYRETSDMTLAAHFLLHDAHEAYIGDITSPVALALSNLLGFAMAEREFIDKEMSKNYSGLIVAIGIKKARESLKAFKSHLDRVIWQAARLSPPNETAASAIATMDLRMLATERRLLFGPCPRIWTTEIERAKPVRLTGRLRVWPWPEAADEYRARLNFFLPHLNPATPKRAKAAQE